MLASDVAISVLLKRFSREERGQTVTALSSCFRTDEASLSRRSIIFATFREVDAIEWSLSLGFLARESEISANDGSPE